MSKQLNIYKPLGKTSVEMIEILKEKFPEYSNQKISYAGRLDPMASGVLILLVGDDENKARREREKSDKEYDFTALFGISSDTYDICGIPTVSGKNVKIEEIESVLNEFKGNISQKIPIYSAYRVRGKPMYVHAAQGTLKLEDVPHIDREIFELEITGHRTITSPQLLSEVKTRLALITRGDFRQEKIISEYESILKNSHREFLLVDFKSHVSSGTYVRSLCNDIGEKLGCGGISIEILRKRSGDFNLKDSIKL
jgi:tRNA pseudouridine55 synthase